SLQFTNLDAYSYVLLISSLPFPSLSFTPNILNSRDASEVTQCTMHLIQSPTTHVSFTLTIAFYVTTTIAVVAILLDTVIMSFKAQPSVRSTLQLHTCPTHQTPSRHVRLAEWAWLSVQASPSRKHKLPQRI